jgi:hypothetical protein
MSDLSDTTNALSWVLSHGVEAVEAVIVIAQAYALKSLWSDCKTCNEKRVEETREFILIAERLHDKIHGTADDLVKVAQFIEKRRP